MTVFFIICFYPVLPILYFVLRNERKIKKNIILGVTIPQEYHEDARVKQIVSHFMKSLNITALLLTLLLIPIFFIPYFSIVLTVMLGWMTLAIIIPYIPFVCANIKLNTLKRKYIPSVSEGDTEVAYASLTVSTQTFPRLSPLWFLPPFIASVLCLALSLKDITSVYYPANLILTASDLFVVVLLWIAYRFFYREKSDGVLGNEELSLAFTRIRKYHWAKAYILLAWTSGIFGVLLYYSLKNAVLLVVVSVIYSIILLVIAIGIEFRIRKVQEQLTQKYPAAQYADEDRYWIWGLFYYNPHDNHFLINARVGIGTGVNLATLAGKLLTGFAVLIILTMPLLGIWCIDEEFTPVAITVEDGELLARHTKLRYQVPLDEIEEVSLVSSLPSVNKSNGGAMDTLYYGSFYVKGYGGCELCLNPENAPFLVVTTEKETYFFGSSEGNAAETLYDEINGYLQRK